MARGFKETSLPPLSRGGILFSSLPVPLHMAIIKFALPIPSFPSRTPSAAEGENMGKFPPGMGRSKSAQWTLFPPLG